MKINTRARYALRLMIELANRNDADKPLNLKDISENQGISQKYLGQIVLSLKNNTLVKGVPGKSGGYILAKKPEDITVEQIFRAAIGPINIVDCVMDPGFCMKTDFCECRPVYVLINQRVTDAMKQFTLSELSEESRKMAAVPAAGDRRDMCSTSFKQQG